MSNLSDKEKSIFDLLNAYSKLKSRDVSIETGLEFAEVRDQRIVKRVVQSLAEGSKELVVEKHYPDDIKHTQLVQTEQSLIDWVRRQDHETEALVRTHALVGERLNNHSIGSQRYAVFRQKFAGIDVDDFIRVVLEKARVPAFSGVPVNRDPAVLLLIWRAVLVTLKALHEQGIVHGDALDENFCLSVQDYWDHNKQCFTNLPAFKAKAIDFGCVMLPAEQRIAINEYAFRDLIDKPRETSLPSEIRKSLCEAYIKASNGDMEAYQRCGSSIDLFSLADSIARQNKYLDIETKAQNLGLFRLDDREVSYNLDAAKNLLLELPNELVRSVTVLRSDSNKTSLSKHTDLIEKIDNVLGLYSADDIKISLNTILTTSNRRIIDFRVISALIILSISLIWWLSQEEISNKITSEKSIIPKLDYIGVISDSDPTYQTCINPSARKILNEIIERWPTSPSLSERTNIQTAFEACLDLLPRENNDHSTHLLAMSMGAYYAVILGKSRTADILLNPAFHVSKTQHYYEMERVLLAQAAVSASLSEEEKFFAALQKAACLGQTRQNLDDEANLHIPYRYTSRYFAVREKFSAQAHNQLPVNKLSTCISQLSIFWKD